MAANRYSSFRRKAGMTAVIWLTLLVASLCGSAHADSAIDTWRSDAALTRILAENDIPAAYKQARHLEATLPADATPADHARLLNLLSRIEIYLAQIDHGAEHARLALALSRRHADQVGQAEAYLNIAAAAINQAKIDELVSATTQVLPVLKGVNRPDLLGEAMLRTAMMYRRLGQLDESITLSMRMLEIARRSGNPVALAYADQGLAIAYDQSGRSADARQYALQMLEQARIARSGLLEADATERLGELAINLGDATGGEKLIRQALARYRAVGGPYFIAHSSFALAEQLRKQSRYAEALSLYNAAISIYERNPNKIGLWWSLNARSATYQAMGRVAAAEADARRGYVLARDIGLALYESESAGRMSAMAAARGEYRLAYQYSVEMAEMSARSKRENASDLMVQLANRYEAESKQRQLADLKRRNEQQTAELKQRTLQQRWLWTLLASVATVLAITAFFLLRLRRSSAEIRALNTGLEERVQARTAELRKQTSYLRSLIDMLPMYAWLKDTESRFLTVNRSLAEATGYTAEAMVGKTDLDFFPQELAEAYRADDTLVMATREQKVVQEEVEHSKSALWIETYKAPVLDEDGTVLGTVGFARDITESKAIADAREAALAEAQRLARMRSEFLAQMSHELRTPLNGILGYAQILRRNKNLDERQAAGLGVIQQSGEHLLTLINDILDSAKIEAGKQELNIVDIPLGRFLRTIAEIISVKTELKHIEFVSDFSPDLPDTVRADEKRLRQVLLNLLANAVKFTDHGQISLHVKFLPPSRLCFEVRDHGIGIAEKDLETIFQPFEQVGEVQHRFGGTGLGLAISQQFVRLMGSEIEVESKVGQGSVFRFALEVPVVTRRTVGPQVKVVSGYLGERKKLLVVDDVAENRAVLIDMLGPIGFEMSEAGNGQEGIAKAQSLQPDLILMDVFMPGMDGLEAARRLRQLPAFGDVPIIAVSASASGSDESSCLAAGMNVFLPKPVDLEKLLGHIAHLLKLDWTYELPETDETLPQAVAASLIIPPPEEMEVLHRMALQGNMRDIVQMATRLIGLDERYRAFAEQLLLLARGYQSRAILSLVEENLAGGAAP